MSHRSIYPLLFFIAVVLLAFWKVIFHGDFTLLVGGDINSLYFPWFDVSAYWLKKGVFLLWDPYVYAGKSFMGEPQPGIFYPLNWVFMLLPTRGGGINLDGLQTLLILDYVLAACFFYLLARSLELSPYGAALAGISFALGGYTVQLCGFINVFSGFVWMPLVLLCFHKALISADWKRRCRWTLGSGSCLASYFPSRPPRPGGAHGISTRGLCRFRGGSELERIRREKLDRAILHPRFGRNHRGFNHRLAMAPVGRMGAARLALGR